jgi:hypothetical protein
LGFEVGNKSPELIDPLNIYCAILFILALIATELYTTASEQKNSTFQMPGTANFYNSWKN